VEAKAAMCLVALLNQSSQEALLLLMVFSGLVWPMAPGHLIWILIIHKEYVPLQDSSQQELIVVQNQTTIPQTSGLRSLITNQAAQAVVSKELGKPIIEFYHTPVFHIPMCMYLMAAFMAVGLIVPSLLNLTRIIKTFASPLLMAVFLWRVCRA
jgi:hypothetical protein